MLNKNNYMLLSHRTSSPEVTAMMLDTVYFVDILPLGLEMCRKTLP